MTKERFERRAYRRSPGRQYGYDYDPLRSTRSGSSQSGRSDASAPGERWPTRGENSSRGASRSGLLLAQRPDPRRTRQLLRQSILAGKSHSASLHEVETEQQDELMIVPEEHNRRAPTDYEQNGYDEREDSTLFRNRYRGYNNRTAEPSPPEEEEFAEIDEVPDEGEWNEFEFVDPDAGYEDPLERRLGQAPPMRSPAPRPFTTSRRHPGDYQRGAYRDELEEYDDEDYDDDERDRPRSRRRDRKQGLTRRKLLVGLGIVAVGGAAAYELGPKVPQAINSLGTNIEHEIQDAYNRGLAAGAEAVRKEFITALHSLEGVSLEGAMAAATLTRLAYDAFVSPIVKLAATITGDFLNLTLQALVIGRGWLARINQDNSTLAALQTVLQTWVKQAQEMPKQLQTITDSDLDGAQAYLRALQRKIQEEQSKLNSPPPSTGTPKPTSTPHR